MRPGDTLHFRYTYVPSEEQIGVRCRSFAKLGGSEEMTLRFRKARMSVHSLGERPEPGIVVHLNEKLRTPSGS